MMFFKNTSDFAWMDERNTVNFQWNLDYSYTPSSISLTITNPGAETGDTTGWTNDTGSLDVRTSSPAPYAGSYYFDGGSNAETKAYQDLDLISDGASSSDIDAGNYLLLVEWYQASYEGDDRAQVYAEFYTSGMSLISSASIGLGAGQPSQTWRYRYMNAQVPANTRYIRLYQHMYRVTGTNNDGYIDAITAKLIYKEYYLSITNRDAETGDTTGWTNELGGLGVSGPADFNYTYGYRFYGGTSAETKAYQSLDLISQGIPSTSINNENCEIKLEWHQAGYSGDNDSAEIIVRFKNSSSELIGYYYSGLNEHDSGWHYHTFTVPVPGQTKYAEIVMHMVRDSGTNNDGYFDEIHATIISREISGSAVVTAVGALTATGTKTGYVSSDLSAIAALIATGTKTGYVSSDLSAVATLTAEGLKSISDSAELTAVATLTAYGLHTASGSPTLTAVGTLYADGYKIGLVSSNLTAVGNLIGVGTKNAFVSSDLTAVGNLDTDAYKSIQESSDLSAVATLTAYGLHTASGSPTLTAVGTLYATGLKVGVVSSDLTAVGNLTGVGSKVGYGDSDITSIAELIADVYKKALGSSEISAVSTLYADGVKSASNSVTLSGVGTLYAEGLKIGIISSTIDGFTSIEAFGTKVGISSSEINAIANLLADGFNAIIIEIWDAQSPTSRTWDEKSKVFRVFTESSEMSRSINKKSKMIRTSELISEITRLWDEKSKLRRR